MRDIDETIQMHRAKRIRDTVMNLISGEQAADPTAAFAGALDGPDTASVLRAMSTVSKIIG
jgi:hypothetical protein